QHQDGEVRVVRTADALVAQGLELVPPGGQAHAPAPVEAPVGADVALGQDELELGAQTAHDTRTMPSWVMVMLSRETSLPSDDSEGPSSFDGHPFTKFQRATCWNAWLYMMIEPFLRASSIFPSSTCLRQFQKSMMSVMPRLRTMSPHWRRPGIFWIRSRPCGSTTLCSTTAVSEPRPSHLVKKPEMVPATSTPYEKPTSGLVLESVGMSPQSLLVTPQPRAGTG